MNGYENAEALAEEAVEEKSIGIERPAAKTAAALSLIIASAMFASGYPLARAINPAAGVDMMILQGMLAGSIILTLLGKKESKLEKGHGWPMLFNGVGSTVTAFLIMEGAKVISPALAAVIVISNSIMVAGFSWLMKRKSFTIVQAAALLAGFAGVVWISLERGVLAGEILGVLYLLLAAVLIALMTMAIENPVKESGGSAITRWSFWVSFAVTAILVAVTGRLHFFSLEQTGLAIFFGVVATGAPSLLFNEGMGKVGAADAAAYKLLIPVFAFVYGIALMGEIPNLSAIAASLLVIFSLGVYQVSNQADSR